MASLCFANHNYIAAPLNGVEMVTRVSQCARFKTPGILSLIRTFTKARASQNSLYLAKGNYGASTNCWQALTCMGAKKLRKSITGGHKIVETATVKTMRE